MWYLLSQGITSQKEQRTGSRKTPYAAGQEKRPHSETETAAQNLYASVEGRGLRGLRPSTTSSALAADASASKYMQLEILAKLQERR